jgi:fructose-bisphosphate aldolase class I
LLELVALPLLEHGDGARLEVDGAASIGARFAKWRAVLRISAQTPSQNAMRANAHALARYAALCQEGGLAPIVEPEVLMEGTHDLDRCGAVTRATLEIVFEELALAGVDLAGIVLKPSMVVPGADGPGASVSEVADATVACLVAAVPATVGGIAFLSGGQSPASATAHLAAINERGPHPWPVTFSFGRAIQDDVLKVWMGSPENVESARSILAERLVANGEAARYELVDA